MTVGREPVPDASAAPRPLWIDGQRVASDATGVITAVDSATGEIYGYAADGSAADIDKAVAAARRAYPAWAATSSSQRTRMLHEAARRLVNLADELTPLLHRETGYSTRTLNPSYFEFAAEIVDFYAELARSETGRVVPSMSRPTEHLELVVKEPIGVVGCFPPSNYPMVLLIWKIAPALAAGNTVVVKPHPANPLIALELAERVFGHLPPGVLNVVTGDREAGARLVEHPDVPMIAFTGSTAVGTSIALAAAPLHKRLNLELSGSDPAIVGASADLDLAATAIAYAAFKNAGQICVSTERVFVVDDVYDEFLERLHARTDALRMGGGTDPDVDVTPLRTAGARARVAALVSDAADRGSTVLTGGAYDPAEPGYFYPPTIVADAPTETRLLHEESFGPVAIVVRVTDFEDALSQANDHELGLGATLYSRDPEEVHEFIRRIQAGNVWINDPMGDNVAAPFGGVKGSGLSRELGQEGLDVYRVTKHVVWDTHGRLKPAWLPRRPAAV